jgi:hypothetical protein
MQGDIFYAAHFIRKPLHTFRNALRLLHAVSILRMHDPAGLNVRSSIAPNCGRRMTMEGKMFKISKSNLKTKSKIQLQFLFNQVALRLSALQNPELDLAQSALAMIKLELQDREP